MLARIFIPALLDAKIITLYNNKGDGSDCSSYRGISLLSIICKAFAGVLSTRMQKLANLASESDSVQQKLFSFFSSANGSVENSKCIYQTCSKGTVLINDSSSEPFSIHSVVKQGCVLAPTIFGVF